jgi:hypothetical protein
MIVHLNRLLDGKNCLKRPWSCEKTSERSIISPEIDALSFKRQSKTGSTGTTSDSAYSNSTSTEISGRPSIAPHLTDGWFSVVAHFL